MERFTIEKHPDKVLHWICVDKENGISCEFEHGNFFGKKVIISHKGKPHPDHFVMLKIEKEMGDWLWENHNNKIR